MCITVSRRETCQTFSGICHKQKAIKNCYAMIFNAFTGSETGKHAAVNQKSHAICMQTCSKCCACMVCADATSPVTFCLCKEMSPTVSRT